MTIETESQRLEASQQNALGLAARVEQLEEIIIRAADFLEVPHAFDNRVQDFEFWLDSPTTKDNLIGKAQAMLDEGAAKISEQNQQLIDTAVKWQCAQLAKEQLEEEIRTVAAHAADLEHKLRRIKDRAVNGMCHGLLADDECRNILAIIEDGDETELEQVMTLTVSCKVARECDGTVTVSPELNLAAPDQKNTVSARRPDTLQAEPSEGGDPD